MLELHRTRGQPSGCRLMKHAGPAAVNTIGLSMCQPVNASTHWAMSAHSCNCMQDGVGKHGNY